MTTEKTEEKIVSPYEFCADLAKDVAMAQPFDRKAIAAGYAKTLESVLEEVKKQAVEDYKHGKSA